MYVAYMLLIRGLWVLQYVVQNIMNPCWLIQLQGYFRSISQTSNTYNSKIQSLETFSLHQSFNVVSNENYCVCVRARVCQSCVLYNNLKMKTILLLITLWSNNYGIDIVDFVDRCGVFMFGSLSLWTVYSGIRIT